MNTFTLLFQPEQLSSDEKSEFYREALDVILTACREATEALDSCAENPGAICVHLNRQV